MRVKIEFDSKLTCSKIWLKTLLNTLAGALPPGNSPDPIERLDRLLLGLSLRMHASRWEICFWACSRLASGIGTGNSTVKHARSIGDLFGSGVFNKNLSCDIFCKIQVDFVWTVILAFFLWLWNLPQILSVDPAALSPHETSETATHNNARRSGLTLGCDLSYHDLPLCTGHDDDGTPVVEMKPWPFLLPNKMVWGLLSRLQFALILPHISCSLGFIFFSIPFAWCLRPKRCWMMVSWISSPTWANWMSTGSICFRSTLHILQLRTIRDLFQSCYMATCHIHQKIEMVDAVFVSFSNVTFRMSYYPVRLWTCETHHFKKSLWWGDEGQAFGCSHMIFHWQPELAPRASDSASSRFLITTIPSSGYVYDGDINITLQCAGQHICNSLTGTKLHVMNPQNEPAPCSDFCLLSLRNSIWFVWGLDSFSSMMIPCVG